ncbi:transporter substrate-binding domain-containing protein [Micromonospora sp. KC723]|uniref:transporter substrate-binding domain-containing protein n=1 Tax=Micromonospora sp. KC723 TaxID=2530381 RepID=UPI00104E3B9C|nr:transporter substrate-binding domain-containing protein [Micromonospora sp. KC723]TDB73190.1 transporter substrate-binding domain-containing protein [Micromonospora sp. KC723]
MDILSDLAPTGTLRASINLGNPVLAQGTPESPSGITVDIARELSAQLGIPLELLCFAAARESFAAMEQDQADICFLAIDPARTESVAFTAPYVVIEGAFAVPEMSPLVSAADVDRPGVRVGVKAGSAYDLHLSRTLKHAEVVRGVEGTTVFTEQQLDVAAGIRQPLADFAAAQGGVRLLEPHFMEIRQAVGTTRSRREQTVAYLHDFVEQLKASGFVAESLGRAGRRDATVAPPG